MSNARVLDVLLGAFAALVMYGLLRRRFLTVDERYLRSFAFVSAGLASLIAWVMPPMLCRSKARRSPAPLASTDACIASDA